MLSLINADRIRQSVYFCLPIEELSKLCQGVSKSDTDPEARVLD
jgi:hypothetical protein